MINELAAVILITLEAKREVYERIYQLSPYEEGAQRAAGSRDAIEEMAEELAKIFAAHGFLQAAEDFRQF